MVVWRVGGDVGEVEKHLALVGETDGLGSYISGPGKGRGIAGCGGVVVGLGHEIGGDGHGGGAICESKGSTKPLERREGEGRGWARVW